MQIQSQNYISNTIQTVNRHMNLQATNAIDRSLTYPQYMKNRIRGYHMNRKYHNRQMRDGYHNSSYMNSKLHKNGMNSKMYDHYNV